MAPSGLKVAAKVPPSGAAANAPGRGAAGALRSRLAAQADALLASGAEHSLRRMLNEPGQTRQERFDQSEEAAKLLLKQPVCQPSTSRCKEEDPIDVEALRRAAEIGDLAALATMDKRLKKLLATDEQLRLVQQGELMEPNAVEALRLYRHSLMSLEGAGRSVEKDAFKAVMRDDGPALAALLSKGVSPGTKNLGGSTLLELAKERNKTSCVDVLLRV